MIEKMLKIELHIHLDGAVSSEIASKISNLPIKEVQKKMVLANECHNLKEYLQKFDFPISLMQTKSNLELVASDLVERLVKENIIYAEIRFAPMFHTKNGLSYEEIIESVLKGLNSNKSIKTNLILCLMRGMSKENNLRTLKVAQKYLHHGVCAIDLAGDEEHYPLDDYKEFFQMAKREHIPFTIHAGEVLESEIEKAIDLGASRLGHGIKCYGNKKLMTLIRNRKVLLEVCPTSNIDTNVIGNYLIHPIFELYKNDIKVCVNTDNPSISNITLNEEYQKLSKYLKLSIDDFKTMNMNAIDGAFISDSEKDELKRRIFNS